MSDDIPKLGDLVGIWKEDEPHDDVWGHRLLAKAEAELAALQAKHDAAIAVIRLAQSHTEELCDAWQRGVLESRDRKDGERSSRNVEVDYRLRYALQKARTSDA